MHGLAQRHDDAAVRCVADGLHGVAEQVHEHAGELRLRALDHHIRQAEVVEMDVLEVVEHGDLLV